MEKVKYKLTQQQCFSQTVVTDDRHQGREHEKNLSLPMTVMIHLHPQMCVHACVRCRCAVAGKFKVMQTHLFRHLPRGVNNEQLER